MPQSIYKKEKLFDRALIAKRIANNPPQNIDFVSQLVIDDLNLRLGAISRKFENCAIIAPIADFLPTKARTAKGEILFSRFATLWSKEKDKLLDGERLKLPKTDYDLIVSLLDLQIIDDVEIYLRNIHAHLADDGLMLVAFIGANSFEQLRQAWLEAESEIYGGASARIAPFIDIKQAGNLLQNCGFTLPVIDIEHYELSYFSPIKLMKELKNLYASNPLYSRPQKMVSKKLLDRVSEKYRQIAMCKDNKISATLDILWLSGWKYHQSQQKPLAPGSAKQSLAKILSDKSDNMLD